MLAELADGLAFARVSNFLHIGQLLYSKGMGTNLLRAAISELQQLSKPLG